MKAEDPLTVEMKAIDWVIIAMLILLVTGVIGWNKSELKARPFTCEYAERHLFAFRQCLNFRPSCQEQTVEAFGEYHKIRNWAELNCPLETDE